MSMKWVSELRSLTGAHAYDVEIYVGITPFQDVIVEIKSLVPKDCIKTLAIILSNHIVAPSIYSHSCNIVLSFS